MSFMSARTLQVLEQILEELITMAPKKVEARMFDISLQKTGIFDDDIADCYRVVSTRAVRIEILYSIGSFVGFFVWYAQMGIFVKDSDFEKKSRTCS